MWQDQAACIGHDPELWHTDGGSDATARKAKQLATAICATCPVAARCLAYAMEHEWNSRSTRHGIWAGTTPTQRQQLSKRDKGRVAPGQNRNRWENVGEPDRSARTLQPGSDRLQPVPKEAATRMIVPEPATTQTPDTHTEPVRLDEAVAETLRLMVAREAKRGDR